jgi:rubrerythrin
MTKRYGKIYSEPIESFRDIVSSSNTYKDILHALGLSHKGHSYTTLKKRITEEHIDISHFYKTVTNIASKDVMDFFVENSPSHATRSLKDKIISNNLKPYVCEICGSLPFHNDRPLVLQLDHINGIHNDNRLENLRFLCPNCHSQTDTYSGKNSGTGKPIENPSIELKTISVKEYVCNNCGTPNYRIDSLGKCIKCNVPGSVCKPKKNRPLKFDITKDELEKLTVKYPLTKIASIYNVSGKAIRKRCDKLGIELGDRRGYWQKM